MKCWARLVSILLMNREVFVKDMEKFLKMDNWDNGVFLMQLMQKYQATPEMLFQRMTNVLPHFFGLNKLAKGYDGVIVAVNHKEYKTLDEKFFKSILSTKGVIVDIKGMYRNKMKSLTYWSL